MIAWWRLPCIVERMQRGFRSSNVALVEPWNPESVSSFYPAPWSFLTYCFDSQVAEVGLPLSPLLFASRFSDLSAAERRQVSLHLRIAPKLKPLS